jgi:hypothetical protein
VDIPLSMLPHRVAVETYLGDTGTDDVYGPKVPGIPCRQEGELLVTADGEYTGKVKLFTRLEHRAKFTRESRVTLAGGTVGHVQAIAEHDSGGLGAWDHLEVGVEA